MGSYCPGICKCLSSGSINADGGACRTSRSASLRIPGYVDEQRAALPVPLFTSIPCFFSDTQESRAEDDRLLVRPWLPGRTFVAGPRGLHARRRPRATAHHYGILLYEHLLGDLARYEAPVSYDVATRVSPRFPLSFWPVNFWIEHRTCILSLLSASLIFLWKFDWK